MHLAVNLCAIVAAWRWGDWRKWKRYQSTVLYMLAVAMMYEFLTRDYTIWRFRPGSFINETIVILVYALIAMPLTCFTFLSRFPEKASRKVLHYLMWIGIYIGAEWLLVLTKRIYYEHGWSVWWSLIFDIIMFPMLRLHFLKPLIAYVLSVVIIVGYMLIFQVPVH